MSGVTLAVTIMVAVGAVLLLAAGILIVVRMSRGPSSLDRVVAADVAVAVVIVALALEAVYHRHSTTLPIMLVLSLLGFSGSVAIARLVADRDLAITSTTTPSAPDPAEDERSVADRTETGER